MKGGNGDNYYYQMIDGIRRFKGVRPAPPLSNPKTIQIDGAFGDWADVQPEFRDDRGDTMHRNHPGYDKAGQYVNTTGRNDFVSLKVARDDDAVYFYARTDKPITPRTGTNWMLLFIDADNDPRTGWQGFDYVVNRRVIGDQTTMLEQASGKGQWRACCKVSYQVTGREMELAIRVRCCRCRPARRCGCSSNGPTTSGGSTRRSSSSMAMRRRTRGSAMSCADAIVLRCPDARRAYCVGGTP